MQPEAQTTTRGFLAVSASTLEMVDRYSRRLRNVLALLYFIILCLSIIFYYYMFSIVI